MHHFHSLTTIIGILSAAPFALGLPQVTDATSTNPTVFTPWSSHPDCAAPASACKSDCTEAVNQLCKEDLTTENIVKSVGECTAWYLYQIGNTIPNFDQCYSAFAYINDAGKPGPDGCGGSFGGALGFDKNGDRTKDPAFAIYPKSGNGNCLRTETSSSAPLAQAMLDETTRLPIEECPSAISRRQLPECAVEDLVWQTGCSAVCIAWVASLTWWTFGTGFAIGVLPCLGACDGIGWKLLKNCEKKNPDGAKLKTRQTIDAPPPDPCPGTQSVGFECPAVRRTLLEFQKCPGAVDDGGEAAGPGNGQINF
ncbi:MAG: hypothetical protein Q9169_004454 [Polycauliona sp. 2 TL-2023]